MVITILDQQNDVIYEIPACIPEPDAIKAAQEIVYEAALGGKILKDEDGENALSPEFVELLKFFPHGRRIAASLMDKMAQDPAKLHMLLSGDPKMADHITAAITEYFENQINISKEYLAMPEYKRQRVRERLFSMMFPAAA